MLRSTFSSSFASKPCCPLLGRLLATAAVGITLTGCVVQSGTTSSAKTSDATVPDTIAPADSSYQAQADAICKPIREGMAAQLSAYEVHDSITGRGRRRIEKVAKPDEVARYVKAVLPDLELQQKQLHDLEVPKSGGNVFASLWDDADKVIAKLKSDPKSAAYTDPFKPLAERLKTLGFRECYQHSRPKVESGPVKNS